ncbi:MAG TPA: AAA family ATPase, partial [Steroidobacteraceae bacterium]
MPIQSEGATSYVLPHLEGRERDVGFVAQLLDRIHQGGATLIVSGEPGIGKSALLEIAKIQARQRGIAVLAMTGVPEESHLPFAGLEQVLRPLLKQIDGLAPRQRSALLTAFGMHDDAAAPPDNFLVGLATLSLLTESASRKPILLVADDGQWIDQPTYDVLAFVARRLSSDPIVLLVAMRDGSGRMFGDAGALRLRLSALDEADAERLLDASAPGLVAEVRRRFLREAAGNPLALLELPRAGVTARAHDAAWLPLTERLERVFSSRLSELP